MLAITHGDPKDKCDTFSDIQVSVRSAVQFFTRWVVIATFERRPSLVLYANMYLLLEINDA